MAGGLGTRSREESGELALALVECGTGKSRSARLRLVPMHSLLPLPFLLPLSFSLPLSPSPFSSSSLLTFLLQTRLYVYTLLFRTQASYGVPTNRALQRSLSLPLFFFLSSPLSTHLLYPLFTYLVSSRDQFLQQRFIAIPFLSLPLFFPSSSLFLSNCLVWGRARRETFPFIPRSIFDRENLIKWMHSFSSGERGKRKIYNSPSLKAGG